MDWAHIIIILLAGILGLLVVAGIGLIISFVLLTARIRHATQSARTAAGNVSDLLRTAKSAVTAAVVAKDWAKGFVKQRKDKTSGKNRKDT